MEQQSKVGATVDRHINVILCSHLMCQLIRTQQAHPAIIILILETVSYALPAQNFADNNNPTASSQVINISSGRRIVDETKNKATK